MMYNFSTDKDGKLNYEIDFCCGCTIPEALERLKVQHEWIIEHRPELGYVFGKFNDRELRSTMSLDDAYITITGKTEKEHQEELRKQSEEYERKKEEYKKRIPSLVEHYSKLASENKGIDPALLDEWKERLKNSLSSFYEDLLVRATLEILEILGTAKDQGKEIALEAAKKKFDEQGHSGNTAAIVGRWTQHFSADKELGDEFFWSQFPECKNRDIAEREGRLIVN